MKFIKFIKFSIVVFLLLGSVSAEWWNSSWHYSFNATVNATNYDRVEIPAEFDVNFTNLLRNKTSGIFDENSVRVIESTSSGGLEERESFFYKSSGFNASANAVGLVVFILNGTTKNNTVRNFTVYFDIIENGPKNSVNYIFSNGTGMWGNYSNTTKRFDEVIDLTYTLTSGSSLSITWKGWINTSSGNFNFTIENTATDCGAYTGHATLTIDDETIISSSDICGSISNSKVLDKGIHKIVLYARSYTESPTDTITIRLKWNASGAIQVIPKKNLYGDAWTFPVNISKGNLTSLYSGIINTPEKFSYYNRGENLSISVNITSANATTKNITCAFINSSNNTKFTNNLTNSSSSLIGEWHSTENCSLNLSHSIGLWKVVCNASDVNGYTLSFENFFNVKSYRPVLTNVTYKNSSAWGAEYNISVNASDPESSVTVALWVCGNGNCNNYGLKSGSLLNWSVNFSCADVGNLSFKFEYNDSDHAPVNTTEYNFSLIPDSVSLTVTKRPALIVNRSEIINISINFYDTDAKKYINNSNGTIYVNQTSQNCSSDSNGNCSALFINTSSWNVGNYSFFGGIFDSCYIQSNTSNDSFSLYGKLNLTINNPSNGSILYKNSTYNFNSTIKDDNGTAVHPQVTWNDNYGVLNNSENFAWRVPLNYPLGGDLVILNVTPPPFYYNLSPVNISVNIYGYSKVEIISPITNLSYNGTPVEFKCRVSDLNGTGIPNYQYVDFWIDTSQKENDEWTDNSGVAPHGGPHLFPPSRPDNYIFKCEISDDTGKYYHAFINNASSTIKISGNITIENVTKDKFFVDMNYGILNLNASIKGIFISNVWAKFEGDGYQNESNLNNISNSCKSNFETCIYSTTFTPSKKGFYNVTVFVNDTANNTVNKTFSNVFFSSDKTYANLSPEPKNKSLLLGERFSVNITLNNTGNATMLDYNLTIQVPYGFSAIPSNFTGNFSMNHSQIFIFNISSNESVYELTNILNFTVAWKNPDNSLNSSKTNISVSVSFPPTLRLDKHYISDAMIDGTSKIIGNFTILSLGNESIEGIVCSIKDGNVDNSWLSYNQSNTFLVIQQNKNETITLNISIPKGTYAGAYISNITCNATFSNCVNPERCVDRLLLNITVSGNKTWEVQSSFNYTVAAVTASNLSIPITNKGNIDMNFVYLIANKSLTNASIALDSNQIYVTKGTTGNILLEFSSAGTGVSYINLTIKNMDTGEIRNISIKVNATDFPPVIENASVYPQDLYVGNVSITANVYDNDKCGVDKVWANITTSNSSVLIMFMSNISNLYSLTYQPGQVGAYKILIYANDTCGMLNKSPEILFTYSADIDKILTEMNQTLANYSAVLASLYNQTSNNTQTLYLINQTLSNYSIVLGGMNLSLNNINNSLNQINSSVSLLAGMSNTLSYVANLTANNTDTLTKINSTLSNYTSVLIQINASVNLSLFKIDALNTTLNLVANMTANNSATLNNINQNLSFIVNETLSNSEILDFLNKTVELVNNRTANNTQILLALNQTIAGYSALFEQLNFSLNELNTSLSQLNASLSILDNMSETISYMANQTENNTKIIAQINQTISSYKDLLTNINSSLYQLNSSLNTIQEMNKTLGMIANLTINNSQVINQMNNNLSFLINTTLNNSLILDFLNKTLDLVNNRTANNTQMLSLINGTLSNHSILLGQMNLSLSDINGSLKQINNSLSILPYMNDTLSYVKNLTANNSETLKTINETLIHYQSLLSDINASVNLSLSGIAGLNQTLNLLVNKTDNNSLALKHVSDNLSFLINKSGILDYLNQTLEFVKNQTINNTLTLANISQNLSNYYSILQSINNTTNNNSDILSALNATINLIDSRTSNNSFIMEHINSTLGIFNEKLDNNTHMLSNISLNLSNYYSMLQGINDTTKNNTAFLLQIGQNISNLSSAVNNVQSNLTSLYSIMLQINGTVSQLNTSVLLSINQTISELSNNVKALNTSTLVSINETLNQVQNNVLQMQNTLNQNTQTLINQGNSITQIQSSIAQVQQNVANQGTTLNQINQKVDALQAINKTIANYSAILQNMSQNIDDLTANYSKFSSIMGEMSIEIKKYNETLNNLTETLYNYSSHITMIDEINKTISDYIYTLNQMNSSISNYSLYSRMLIIMNETLANYSAMLGSINASTQNYSYYSSLLQEMNSTLENYNLILSQISSNTSNIPSIMDYVSNVNSTIEKLSDSLSQVDVLFDRSWNIKPETSNIPALTGDSGYINLTIQNTGLFDFNFNVTISGNNTLFSSAPSNVFVPRKDSRVLPVFYSVGNISDGIYLLNVSVSNANSTPSERNVYIYLGVSQYVPSIKEFLISTNPVLLGSPEMITVSVNDYFAVDDVWIQLDGVDVDYTLKSGNSWVFVLNTSDLSTGDNEFTVFARDFNGNIKNRSSWFEIYNQKIFFAGESIVLIDLKFYRPGTESKEDIILNFSNTGIEYNETITARNYDIVFEALGNTIKVFNASLNHSFYNPIIFEDVSLGDVSIGNTSGVLRVLYINASDDFRNAFSRGLITLNYSGRSFDVEKQVRIYQCKEFNPLTKKCSGTWDIVGNSTIDFNKHTISAGITGFSAYAAARAIICGDGLCDSVYGERCEKCSIDCGTCPPVSSGGGGGAVSGGGTSVDISPIYKELQALKDSLKNISPTIIEAVSNYTNVTQALVSPIKVEPDGLDIVLSSGESKNYSIKLFNDMGVNLTAFVSLTGELIGFIEVGDKVVLNPKSYSVLKFMAYAYNVSEGRDYYGEIKITAESYNKSVPVHISVLVNEPILEPKISIATEEIQPDGNIRFNVLLSNAGYKKKFNVELVYRVRDSENKVIKEEREIISMDDYASFERNFSFKDANLNSGQYVVEVESNYLNKKVSRIAAFRVPVPYSVYFLLIFIIVILAGLVFALYRLRKYLRAKELEKLKYAVPVDVKKLPIGDVWLGNISEKNIKAFFDMDDITTHMIVAGSTGSGKTVTAMGIIESLLERGIPVVVFDPTAQWTGFLRVNKDEKMFRYYPKFGLKREDARSFKGMIYEVTSSDLQLDLRKYMNPGEVSVFTLNKVPPEEYSRAVENVVKSIFAIPWEESSSLKMVVVFDEVHRLLKKFGEEEGYVSLEKACREFRKWGIGLIMVSQVLSDFKEQIKGNILTEVQLHTKSLADIGRVAEKYGADYSRSVTLMEVGTGMVQNPKYNGGRPWFVDFKPLVSSPHKLAESEISEYKRFDTMLKEIESEIVILKNSGLDVFDLELELKLARDKLKEAKFRMIEIYVDSLKSSLKKKQK